MNKNLPSPNGFSLVEILVGSTLLLLVSFFLSSFLSTQSKVSRTYDTSADTSMISMQIANILSDPNLCYKNLIGVIPSPTPTPQSTLTSIKYGADDEILKNTKLSQQSDLQITEIEVLPPQSISSTTGVGVGQLKISFRKDLAGSRKTVGGETTIRLIPFTAIFCDSSLSNLIPGANLDAYDAEIGANQYCDNIHSGANGFVHLPSLRKNTNNWQFHCLFNCSVTQKIYDCL